MNNRYIAAVGKLLRRTVIVSIARAIGIAWFLLKILIPVLWWMFVQGMWMGLFTLVAMCQGLPEHCRKLADTWTERAIKDYKLTTNFENMVRNFLETVAWLVTFTGWVIIAHVTVWICRLIF
jgi:hypothetical protein